MINLRGIRAYHHDVKVVERFAQSDQLARHPETGMTAPKHDGTFFFVLRSGLSHRLFLKFVVRLPTTRDPRRGYISSRLNILVYLPGATAEEFGDAVIYAKLAQI